MAASLRVAGLVPQASSKTTARNCRTALEMVSRRQLTPNCSGGGTATKGRNSTPRAGNGPAAGPAHGELSGRRLGRESDPQPAGDRDQAALQRGRLEHDRRRDTAAGQDVVHQVVVERRGEGPPGQDEGARGGEVR